MHLNEKDTLPVVEPMKNDLNVAKFKRPWQQLNTKRFSSYEHFFIMKLICQEERRSKNKGLI